MQIVKISKVKPNPSNPRLIKDDKFKKLVQSIIDFPEMLEIRPIVVDSDMVILGGNMRYKACKEAGLKEIPIIIADKLTEEQKKEFIIKDNVSGGEWDYDELANNWDIEKLEEWGLDIPDFEIEEDETEEDDFEEPENIKVDVKLGDFIEIGKHTLFCGDSTKQSDIEKAFKGIKADMIFTDPPYDLEDSYSQYIFDSAKEDCHIFIMNSDKLLIQNINNGFDIFRKIFSVDFRQPRLVSNNQPMTRIDLIAEFLKGKGKFINLFDGFSTLIECAKIHNDNQKSNFGHKQAKKIDLPQTFILHYTVENEIVFDFFGGSGSTMAACEVNNRICKMIEFDTKNCQIIINRMVSLYNLKVKINGIEYEPEIKEQVPF